MSGYVLYTLHVCVQALHAVQQTQDEPYLQILLCSECLAHYTDVVMEGWRLGSSLKGNEKVRPCFLPPSLETAQVPHVGVTIDVVGFEWECFEISLFSFLWSICEGIGWLVKERTSWSPKKLDFTARVISPFSWCGKVLSIELPSDHHSSTYQ